MKGWWAKYATSERTIEYSEVIGKVSEPPVMATRGKRWKARMGLSKLAVFDVVPSGFFIAPGMRNWIPGTSR